MRKLSIPVFIAIALQAINQSQVEAQPLRAFRIRHAHQIGCLDDRRMDISYPYLTGTPKRTAQKINRAIHDCINRQIGPFAPGTEQHEYDCTYEIKTFDARTLSVVFKFYLPAGGASGDEQRLIGFNCNLADGSIRDISCALGRDFDYNRLFKALQSKRGEPVWNPRSRKVTANDFSNFVFRNGGIELLYSQGEMGAMALGAQRFAFTADEIRRLRTSPFPKKSRARGRTLKKTERL
jgi:hypothetical protein